MKILLLAALLCSPAAAQVTVNPGALDGPAPSTRPPLRVPPRPAAPRPPAIPAGPRNPPTAATTPVVRVVPDAPPANPPPVVALPPPLVVPLSRPPPPPPIAVTADAPGSASPEPGGGLRITFGPDRQDLNTVTEAALRGFAKGLKANEQTAVNVMAYAAGAPDDPSTPRRVSLARALAARAVLISEGIASTRIYVRALGANVPDDPADRVDLTPAAPAATAAARP